jgi:hypothetical protein
MDDMFDAAPLDEAGMPSWPLLTGAPETARSLAAALDAAGLRCFVEERTSLAAETAVHVPVEATVLVHSEERERAELVLAQWRLGSEARSAEAVRRVRNVLLASVVPPLGYAGAVFVGSGGAELPSLAIAIVLWWPSVILAGLYENLRYRSERIARPPGLP